MNSNVPVIAGAHKNDNKFGADRMKNKEIGGRAARRKFLLDANDK